MHGKKRLIRVYAFSDAPKRFQILSGHGGDEDWLAILPPHYKDNPPPWMMSGTSFGVCDTQFIEHPEKSGWTIAIGAHS